MAYESHGQWMCLSSGWPRWLATPLPSRHNPPFPTPPVCGAQVLQLDTRAHNLHERLTARHDAQVKQQVAGLAGRGCSG